MPTPESFVQTVPINPLEGMYGMKPSESIPSGGSPDMVNLYVRGDALRKRPGFAQLGSNNVHATERVMGIYSAWDKNGDVFLFAAHETGLKGLIANVWTAYAGPALTGGNERLFNWTVSQNSVVFSQGLNQVMRVPFTGLVYAILNANCPPARFLVRFADRLYLGHTVEVGINEPFRIRRSVFGDHTDWVGIGSGFNDLAEYPYHIRGMIKQGAQLFIGAEGALWIASRTGISDAPARFDPVVPGVGIHAPYTLASIRNDHAFLGLDQFYVFSGARVVEIGDQIRDSVFLSLNSAKIHMAHSVIRPDTQEWVVFLAVGSAVTTNIAWIWNWQKNIWYPWNVSGHMCATSHRALPSKTWDALVGTWDEQTWEWDSPLGATTFSLLVTGHSNGKAYAWDDSYRSDDGVPISCRWTSRDFTSSNIAGAEFRDRKITLRKLIITYRDSGSDATLNFYLSTDSGGSWAGPFPVFLTGGLTGDHHAVLTEMITGNRIQWKFEHSSDTETFQIVQFLPEFEILGLPIS